MRSKHCYYVFFWRKNIKIFTNAYVYHYTYNYGYRYDHAYGHGID